MRVAIVGAGAAGLGAAYALRGRGHQVTLFEKSRGLFGRAATRRRGPVVYDHGANYVTSEDPTVAALIQKTLPSEGRVEVQGPIWTFDRTGRIAPGKVQMHHRWSYRSGITALGKYLLAASDAEFRPRSRVTGLAYTEAGWHLEFEAGAAGPFDRLLLTAPAPQTAALLEAAEGLDGQTAVLAAAAREARYRSILSLVLHYPFRLERPYYALLNVDREHPVGWLSRESCKAGHVPAGESVLIVQMSPVWSTHHFEREAAANLSAAAGHVAALLDDDRLAAPDWWDQQRWRYALPERAAGEMRGAESAGLYVAGDWIGGTGRVHLALASGLATGARMAAAAPPSPS